MRPFLRPRLAQSAVKRPTPSLSSVRCKTKQARSAAAHEPSFTSTEAASILISRPNTSYTKRISITRPDAYRSFQKLDADLTFDARYLRDWCACEKCRHPETNQRLLDTYALPADLHAASINTDAAGLRVTWSDTGAEAKGHESTYSWEWLLSHHSDAPKKPAHKPIYWLADIAKDPPMVEYAKAMESQEGLREWVNKIRDYGYCYVDGCPVDPIATQRLIERISFIRPTHYGGFWDFTADLASKDTAYTNLELPVHTDTTYFADPAGLQMFHLLSHTDGRGGESLLTDGFHAAKILAERHPEAFRRLAKTEIMAHATGNEDAKIITPVPFPVIQRAGPEVAGEVLGKVELLKIRWNNDDRGSFAAGTTQRDVASWYDAAAKFKEILDDPRHKYRSQLRPGRPLIFDNWRVLHGRTSFDGKRRLCGAYVNMDDFLSKWRTLNLSGKEIAAAI